MAFNLVKHMVQEWHAIVELGFAGSIEVNVDTDLSFTGIALDLRGSSHANIAMLMGGLNMY